MTALPLAYPVTIGAEVYSKLTFRRLIARQVIEAHDTGSTDAAREARMVAASAGVPIQVIEELDAGDYAAARQVLAGFLSPTRPNSAGA